MKLLSANRWCEVEIVLNKELSPAKHQHSWDRESDETPSTTTWTDLFERKLDSKNKALRVSHNMKAWRSNIFEVSSVTARVSAYFWIDSCYIDETRTIRSPFDFWWRKLYFLSLIIPECSIFFMRSMLMIFYMTFEIISNRAVVVLNNAIFMI